MRPVWDSGLQVAGLGLKPLLRSAVPADMKKAGIAITVLILTACGSVATHPSTSPVAGVTGTPGATSPSAASPFASPTGSKAQSPKPSPTASPKVSPTLLFAVLEAKGTANAWTYNTVAI